jgi:hypothetical protein
MPRFELVVGERYNPPGPFGAEWKPERTQIHRVMYVMAVPPKPPRQRPHCKTCNDRVCVGNCKF